jgi:truncated hemoglobin YjbI
VSLYDSLGQQAGITTAVDQFYVRVSGPVARALLRRRRRRQGQGAPGRLLSTVSGGPQVYSGASMELSHRTWA